MRLVTAFLACLLLLPVGVFADDSCGNLLKSDKQVLFELAEMHVQIEEEQAKENSGVLIVLKAEYERILRDLKSNNTDLSSLPEIIAELREKNSQKINAEKARSEKAEEAEAEFGPFKEKYRINIKVDLNYESKNRLFYRDTNKDQSLSVWTNNFRTSISDIKEQSKVVLFDFQEQKLRSSDQFNFTTSKTVFSADGTKIFVVTDDEGLAAIDTKALKLIEGQRTKAIEYITALSASPDGKYIVAGHHLGQVSVYNAQNLENIFSSPQYTIGTIDKVFFTPTGDRMVAMSLNGNLVVWDTNDFELIYKIDGMFDAFGHKGRIQSWVVDSAGEYLYTAGEDNLVKAFHLTDLTKSFQIHKDRHHIMGMKLSNNGEQLAIVTAEGDVKIFSISDNEIINEFQLPKQSLTSQLQFSSDDHLLLLFDSQGNALVYDWQTGRLANSSPDSVRGLRKGSYLKNNRNVIGLSDNEIVLWSNEIEKENK